MRTSALLTALHELLPASQTEIKNSFELTADSVLKALSTVGISLDSFQVIPDFIDGDWDDDDALGELVFQDHEHFHKGPIWIHAPACSRYDLDDFCCDAGALKQFIHQYDIEMLFNGDVIFLAPQSRTLTVFHDEGAFGHARL